MNSTEKTNQINTITEQSLKPYRLEWEEDNKKIVVWLGLNEKAQDKVEDFEKNLSNEKIFQALIREGAVFNDANGEAAWQEFNIKNGNKICLVHYQKNELQRPETGEGATVEQYDYMSGKLLFLQDYENNLLHGPDPKRPAHIRFDDYTGLPVEVGLYNKGRLIRNLDENELRE